MSITVPNNLEEKIVYIWKILDREFIDWKDLVYYIAFQLHLTNPETAKKEILEALKLGFFKPSANNQLSLSEPLKKKFDQFQKDGVIKYRKMLGLLNTPWGDGPSKFQSFVKKSGTADGKDSGEANKKSSEFEAGKAEIKNELENMDVKKKLELMTVASSVQSGLKIDKNDIEFIKMDFENGIITGKVKGSETNVYTFQIDAKTKGVSHNCIDFSKNKARKKNICKHLVKVFELLLTEHGENGQNLINNIIENRLTWNFFG